MHKASTTTSRSLPKERGTAVPASSLEKEEDKWQVRINAAVEAAVAQTTEVVSRTYCKIVGTHRVLHLGATVFRESATVLWVG